MEIRHVRFRVSGGLAGLVRGAEVDGSDLSAGERRALEAASADPGPQRDPRARDALTYELELDTDDGVRRVEFDEFSTPTELAGLVQRLSTSARPVRP